jgi:ABC-type antimicrobial peptide transport system permease subunit
MFLTYLRRELRRRMRQAIFVSLGLALGIGLVITVTAASAGVKNAQSSVLHSLYGVGTDVTVTQSPSRGSNKPFSFRISGGPTSPGKTGTSFKRDSLVSVGLGTIKASSVASISRLRHVSAAAGALNLTDIRISGTVPSSSEGTALNGGGKGSVTPTTFSVAGVDLSASGLGALSSGKVTSGRTFTAADSNSNVAVVEAGYAKGANLKTGSTVTVAGKKFKVIGIVSVPQGGTSTSVYIPLARAQALAGMKGEVNTIYVAATSASYVSSVSKEISALLPKATVTTSSSLASEVTGSLASAASLANNLGKWLAIAVLAVAFGLASLLTMAAVSRRVREFGTLKALGWRSRRIIRQVIGEALALGVIGGLAGVGLGLGGAMLVSKLAPTLTASTGLANGSAAPSANTPAGAGPGGSSGTGRLASDAAHTVAVHLSAPVTASVIILAVGLAIVGGLTAGLFGGWRAARLRPAAALSRVA